MTRTDLIEAARKNKGWYECKICGDEVYARGPIKCRSCLQRERYERNKK